MLFRSQAHGETPEAPILHQTAEGFDTQAACPDVRMAVNTAPQPSLGIVEVERGKTLQANQLVKLGERQASGAADSHSEARAEAISGRLQALVRQWRLGLGPLR